VLSACRSALREHSLDPDWHSVGRLLDHMGRDEANDDVVAWLCEELYKRGEITRSCFLRPFFRIVGLEAVCS
jgi:hypothetical protein